MARWTVAARGVYDVARIARERRLLRRGSARGAAKLARQLLSGRRDLYLVIDTHALTRPTDPAVSDAHGTWTWAELGATVNRLAAALAAAGVVAGDRVAILLENRREHVAAMAATRALAAVPVPLSPALAAPQVVERLRETSSAAAFVEVPHVEAAVAGVNGGRHRVVVVGGAGTKRAVAWDELLSRAPATPRRPLARDRDAPDVVLHTSGTTGKSRGTAIKMGKAGVDTALRYVEGFDLDGDAVLYTPCPLYHAAPMLLTGLVLTLGGHVVLRPKWEDDAVEVMLRAGATHTFLVPTLLDRLSRVDDATADRLRRSRLRALISGGAALRPALKRVLLDRFGPVLYDFYGATEMGVVSIAGPGDLACRPDTVGRLLPGVEAKLVADDGHEAATGEPGELFVRSAAATEHEPGDGWVSAGDVARIDGDLLFIVDRKRDVVISGGVNLFPVDIEVVVERFPTVREAAAIGVPDDQWGEALQVFVVLAPGATLDVDGLREHCRANLARYAIPKAFLVVDELPRSPTGKVLRRELRDRLVKPA